MVQYGDLLDLQLIINLRQAKMGSPCMIDTIPWLIKLLFLKWGWCGFHFNNFNFFKRKKKRDEKFN